MLRKWGLPLAAVGLMSFAIYHTVAASQAPPKPEPPINPARSPYRSTLAGAGVIEPQTENVAIGSHLPGIVADVFVRVGDRVTPGMPLFRLDERQLQAEAASRSANVAVMQAQLRKLENMPRAEEKSPVEARVAETQANLTEMADQYRRAQTLIQSRAIGDEELTRRRQAYEMAKQQHNRALADYKLLLAGAWEQDLNVARANLKQAEAQLAQTQVELDRLTVKAPIPRSAQPEVPVPTCWEVLQINVRPGEFVAAPSNQTLIVLGNIETLHVRADIDENDLARFKPGATGTAKTRGIPKYDLKLHFVRVEPYVVPKRSLIGSTTERVDTRVLQVIYRVEPGPARLYVGQQVDVFIEAEPLAEMKPVNAVSTGSH